MPYYIDCYARRSRACLHSAPFPPRQSFPHEPDLTEPPLGDARWYPVWRVAYLRLVQQAWLPTDCVAARGLS